MPTPNPPGPSTPTRKPWVDVIVNAHVAVAGPNVSHATRLRSYRYFVWDEDERNDLTADNLHAEKAVNGYSDLFTKTEFDKWANDIEDSFDAYGIAWEKTGVTYEPDTGYIHHIFTCEAV